MVGALCEYRFFVVNDRGEVQSSRFALCEDDAEAAEIAAGSGGDDADVEVWDVGRFVAKVRRVKMRKQSIN